MQLEARPRGGAVRAARGPAGRGREALLQRLGVIVIPKRAASGVNCCSVAAGAASQPKTKGCTKPAPVSLERRCTQPICRALGSAVTVKRVRMVRARGGMVVIGEAPRSVWGG